MGKKNVHTRSNANWTTIENLELYYKKQILGQKVTNIAFDLGRSPAAVQTQAAILHKSMLCPQKIALKEAQRLETQAENLRKYAESF